MNTKSKTLLIALLAVGALSFSSQFVKAEDMEGSHMDGSHMEMGKAGVAIDGYCPVCITKGKYMKGSPKFSTEYNGQVYYFPGFDQQKMFINEPEAYIQDLEKKYADLKMQAEGSHKAEGSH